MTNVLKYKIKIGSGYARPIFSTDGRGILRGNLGVPLEPIEEVII
jgi:hypothetical protein